MAITVTGLTIHTQTGLGTWNDIGGGGGSGDTTDNFFSSTSARGRKFSGLKGMEYQINAAGTDLTNTVIVLRFLLNGGFAATLAAGGGYLILTDTGGNSNYYYVSGSDVYTAGWNVVSVSTTNSASANSGTAATLTAIEYVGMVVNASGASGGDDNFYIDEVLSFPDTGLTISNNTTALVEDMISWDDTGLYGIVTERSGIAFSIAPWILAPDATGISSTDETIVFEDPFYEDGTNIDSALNNIGLSSTDSDPITLTRFTAIAYWNPNVNGTDAARSVDFSSATNVTMDASFFIGFEAATNPMRLGGSGNSYDATTFNFCGQVADTGAVIRDCIFRNPTDADGAYGWTTSTDMQDTTFFSDGTGHGIDIISAPTAPTTEAFIGIVGVGYGADNTANATIDNNTGHNVAIAASGGSTGLTVNTTTNTSVTNTVTVSVTAVTAAGTPVTGARVLVEAAAGDALPARESVTITRSGTTATVAHTAHGVPDGTEVVIRGAAQSEYNGVFTVTVTTANAYTYTVAGSPTTPATGTITASSVIVAGTTDGSGIVSTAAFNYTADQAITGRVRRGTTSPLYKQAVVTGSIDSGGFSTTVVMISDE